MAKKIIKVEDKKKNKIDLDKIKDVIVDNKDTIAKIVDIAGDFLDDDKDTKKSSKKSGKTTKKASSKSSKKKSSKSSSASDLSTMIDLAGKFLK